MSASKKKVTELISEQIATNPIDIERTEGKQNFSVKANRTLTHETDSNWKSRAEEMKAGIRSLEEKKRERNIAFCSVLVYK